MLFGAASNVQQIRPLSAKIRRAVDRVVADAVQMGIRNPDAVIGMITAVVGLSGAAIDRAVSYGIQQFTSYVTPQKGKRPLEADVSPDGSTKKLRGNMPYSRRNPATLVPSDDIDMDSPDGPDGPTAALTSGAVHGPVAHETKITVPPTITYGMPDTWTTKMPYHGVFLAKINENGAHFGIRMNSVYDIIKTVPTTYAGLGTNGFSYENSSGRTFDGAVGTGNNQPAWRPFFNGRYAYYTVLSTKWRLHVMPITSAADNSLAVIPLYRGSFQPPTGKKFHEYMYWKGREKMLIVKNTEITETAPIQTISGSWVPGKHKREVRDDADAKTWTGVGANPTLAEDLDLIFVENPIGVHGDQYVHCMLDIQYTVQWKELTDSIKYPDTSVPDFTYTL